MAKSESTKIEFGYFHDYESEQFAFYRIPKVLFTDEYFRNLSSDAKVLYGLMLDRMALSIRHQWFDEEGNPSISEREKLVILLSHIEPLIYNTLNYTKQPYSKVKQIVKRMSIDENEGMSSESVGKLYVMGITYVVFANTDAYTKEIDKRIPFRNNILHNGIVEYGTDDIHSAYELLVEFISMLVFIKKQLINEKTK